MQSTLGILLSGGLDSSILLATMLERGYRVQPFYIRADVVWAAAELAAIRRYLEVMETPALEDLIVFDVPLADLYLNHWSVSGVRTPDAATPDEAVFLPGRNALLAIKPLLWCQSHGVKELALAILANNPFHDARPEFFDLFNAAMTVGGGGAEVRVTRPFARLSKDEVLKLGRHLPLAHTFRASPLVTTGTVAAVISAANARRRSAARESAIPLNMPRRQTSKFCRLKPAASSNAKFSRQERFLCIVSRAKSTSVTATACSITRANAAICTGIMAER